jgi:hypothetical protein
LKILTKKALIPIIILLGFVSIVYVIMSNSPQVVRKDVSKVVQLAVEIQMLKPRSYQMQLQSYGTVEPRTRGELISQVGGKIDFISDKFRPGGFFEGRR